MAFELEGFCVVRGPDLLWGGDIKCFHPPAGKFDGVIGGPPCQAFSRLRHLVKHNGYAVAEDLIPEFARVVTEVAPTWWVMENVMQAPPPFPRAFRHILNNRWVGADQNRLRVFYSDLAFQIEQVALESPIWEPAVCASGGAAPIPVKIVGNGKVKRSFTERHVATRKGASAMGFKTEPYFREACRLQGLPDDFLSTAPFTVAGKIKCVGNGVPLPMGRAVAKAVRKALNA